MSTLLTHQPWRTGATLSTTAKVSRIARAAAAEIGCTAKTAQHLLHSSNLRVAAFVRQCLALGEHDALATLLRPIEQAKRHTPPVLTDALVLDKVCIDAQENEALAAYLLTKGAAERDTEIRRLRREAVASISLADALEAAV